jgi:hypothetical protein
MWAQSLQKRHGGGRDRARPTDVDPTPCAHPGLPLEGALLQFRAAPDRPGPGAFEYPSAGMRP